MPKGAREITDKMAAVLSDMVSGESLRDHKHLTATMGALERRGLIVRPENEPYRVTDAGRRAIGAATESRSSEDEAPPASDDWVCDNARSHGPGPVVVCAGDGTAPSGQGVCDACLAVDREAEEHEAAVLTDQARHEEALSASQTADTVSDGESPGEGTKGAENGTQPWESAPWDLPDHVAEQLQKIRDGVWGTRARDVAAGVEPVEGETPTRYAARVRHELYRNGRDGAADQLSLAKGE